MKHTTISTDTADFMGKIEMPCLFRRSSSCKSRSSGFPVPAAQEERASGFPAAQEERASRFPAPMAEEEMERVSRMVDADGDGRISRPELAALFVHAGANGEVFRVFDADGRIFRPQLKALVGMMAEADLPAADELSGMMAEVDGDGDGFMSLHVAAEEDVEEEVPCRDDGGEFGAEAGNPVRSGGGRCRGCVMRVSAAEENNVEQDTRIKKLKWMVGILGGLSASAATTALAMYKSKRDVAAHGGGEVAYRVVIASVFVASVAKMVAASAFWFSSGPQTPEARGTGKKILYVSIVTLVLSVALCGVAIFLKM